MAKNKFIIAFDCDGTLVTTFSIKSGKIVANERIRTLLITLATLKFIAMQDDEYPREIEIWVWSGAGEIWAHQVVRELGLTKYVHQVKSKNIIGHDAKGHPIFDPEETPDWAIDDIHACRLGGTNLIVKEK